MRTLMFALAAFCAVGLAQASQPTDPGAPSPAMPTSSPEPASPRPPGPDPFVVVDPMCAFDGSGCTALPPAPMQAATPPGNEVPLQDPQMRPAQGSEAQPAQASEPQPAQAQPAQASQSQPAQAQPAQEAGAASQPQPAEAQPTPPGP